jgi:hypothetical protein
VSVLLPPGECGTRLEDWGWRDGEGVRPHPLGSRLPSQQSPELLSYTNPASLSAARTLE